MLHGRTGPNSYEEIRSYSLRLAFQEAIPLSPNRLPRLRGVPTGPASQLVPQTPGALGHVSPTGCGSNEPSRAATASALCLPLSH